MNVLKSTTAKAKKFAHAASAAVAAARQSWMEEEATNDVARNTDANSGNTQHTTSNLSGLHSYGSNILGGGAHNAELDAEHAKLREYVQTVRRVGLIVDTVLIWSQPTSIAEGVVLHEETTRKGHLVRAYSEVPEEATFVTENGTPLLRVDERTFVLGGHVEVRSDECEAARGALNAIGDADADDACLVDRGGDEHVCAVLPLRTAATLLEKLSGQRLGDGVPCFKAKALSADVDTPHRHVTLEGSGHHGFLLFDVSALPAPLLSVHSPLHSVVLRRIDALHHRFVHVTVHIGSRAHRRKMMAALRHSSPAVKETMRRASAAHSDEQRVDTVPARRSLLFDAVEPTDGRDEAAARDTNATDASAHASASASATSSRAAPAACAPPAPPPPPPMRDNGGESTPASKTKHLHWKTLPSHKVIGTIWGSEFRDSIGLDLSELDALFEKSASHRVLRSADVGDAEHGSTPRLLSFYSRQRQTNVLIAYRRLGYASVPALIDAVRCDARALRTDECASLLAVVAPTDDEQRMQAQHESDGEGRRADADGGVDEERQWAEAEALHRRMLAAMPNVRAVVDAQVVRATFDDKVRSVERQLACVQSACTELMASAKLPAVLAAVLKLGNALNRGTRHGRAHGFRLDSLLKLSEMRAASATATEKATTLLTYLVYVLDRQQPRLLDWYAELSQCAAAANVSLEEVRAAMVDVQAPVARLRRLFDGGEQHGTDVEGNVRAFLDEAAERCDELERVYAHVHDKYAYCATLFGEEASTPSTVLFGILRHFGDDFEAELRALRSAQASGAPPLITPPPPADDDDDEEEEELDGEEVSAVVEEGPGDANGVEARASANGDGGDARTSKLRRWRRRGKEKSVDDGVAEDGATDADADVDAEAPALSRTHRLSLRLSRLRSKMKRQA